MKYPLRSNYELAVKNLNVFIHDPVLKSGKATVQNTNPNFLRAYGGGKAVVFEIKTNPQKYALKCWVEDLGDLKYRYKAIDEYLKQSQLPYFVDFSYTEQGIFVNGNKFPIVRMEWVDGIDLKTFIDNNIHQSIHLSNLANKFLEMMKVLHQNRISHGDLQHGNIMIRKNGSVCLIDYDSLCVPQLSNEKDNIKGLPGYQHPNRYYLAKLSPKADYFSELVIYLSLIFLAKEPSYWQDIKGEERLLFSYDDLAKPESSNIFKKLGNHSSDEIQYFAKKLENFCREPDLENLIPLEDLTSNFRGTWDIVTNGNQSKPNLNLPAQAPVNSTYSSNAAISTASNDKNIINWEDKLKQNSSKNNKSNQIVNWDSKFNNKSNQIVDWDSKFSNKSNQTFDWGSKFASSTSKDKFDKLTQKTTPEPSYKENQYQSPSSNNNENIWDKFTKSVSSIWEKIVNWLPF